MVAACHSLAVVDGRVLGDPAEEAAVRFVGWRVRAASAFPSARGCQMAEEDFVAEVGGDTAENEQILPNNCQ